MLCWAGADESLDLMMGGAEVHFLHPMNGALVEQAEMGTWIAVQVCMCVRACACTRECLRARAWVYACACMCVSERARQGGWETRRMEYARVLAPRIACVWCVLWSVRAYISARVRCL